jgi:phospholipid/cholesterol/gamma-HCH transport system substrate-binding protein
MPRTRSLHWSELKIGIVAVIAIVLAVFLIVAVGGQGGLFSWERYELRTKFTNVMGLKSGAVVRVAGVEVGKVTDVRLEGAEVLVIFEVNDEHQSRITDQSRASIGSLSLLGEPIIDVTPASAGRPLQDGEFIQSKSSGGSIMDLAEPVQAGVAEATALLQDIRQGKGTVGKLFTDEAVYREFQALLDSAEGVIAGVNRGQGTLGKLAKDDAAYRRLEASLADLNEMTRRIRAGEGSLGKLLNDDALAKSFTSTAKSFDEISAKLNKGEGTAGKLLNDKQLYDRFNSITERLDKLISTLEKGEGTAGRLLQDKALYENINGAVAEFKTLIADIRKDPKKFLNVRVSIW